MTDESVKLVKKGLSDGSCVVRGVFDNSVMENLLGPTLSISWNENVKLGRGAFAVVYEGLFNDKKLAVKKIHKANLNPDFGDKKEDTLKLLEHPNIVKLYSVLHQVDFKYVIMELCDATLQQYGMGQYKGPIPSEEDGLYQMASGLDYIHSQQLAHCNIKPSNVLISKTQPVQLKWSDFGISKSMDACGTFSLNTPTGVYDWMAPEILDDLVNMEVSQPGQIVLRRNRALSDVFSAGCVFFFFLKPPLHPFGHEAFVRANIIEGNPTFLEKLCKNHFAFHLISEMIKCNSEERINPSNVLEKLKLRLKTNKWEGPKKLKRKKIVLAKKSYSKNDLIGHGCFGPIFRDVFQTKPVAVQRVGRVSVAELKKQEEISWCALKQDNIEYLCAMINDDTFRFYVTELYTVSLDQLFSEPKVALPKIPGEEQVLLQLANGLAYIHSQGLVYRYIMPSNVLFYDSERVKWANLFGLKSLETTPEMLNWAAPEILDIENSHECFEFCDTYSDVFSVGCVFFFFLSKGVHLFGSSPGSIQSNILNSNNVNLEILIKEPIVNLIGRLTLEWDNLRPSMSEVVDMLTTLYKHQLQKLDERTLSIRYFSDVELLKGSGPNHSSDKIQTCSDYKDDLISEYHIKTPYLTIKEKSVRCLTNAVYRFGGHEYCQGIFRGKRVTIKKYSQTFGNPEANVLKLLDHPNVIKSYIGLSSVGVVLDPFVATLDQLFLSDDNPQKYNGPMPSDEKVLYQLANGLEYIHRKRILHRNIKPENILISSVTELVQLKLANFEFASTSGANLSYNIKYEDKPPNPSESIVWIAPEILKELSLDKSYLLEWSVQTDVFSMGCVFLYYLLRGIHPFGSEDWAVPSNIIEGNPINLKELSADHFARPIAIPMIERDPAKRITLSHLIRLLNPLQTINSLKENRLSVVHYFGSENVIVSGAFSSIYLMPMLNRTSVMVKRIPLGTSSTSSEFTKTLFEELKTLHHPNVVRLLKYDHDNRYKYFSMELCSVSLDQCFTQEGGNKLYIYRMPTNEQFLFQLASGLDYIHSKGYVHGSIKPSNVLLSASYCDPQVKLSDFGLTRESQTISSFKDASDWNMQHLTFWMPPELLGTLLQHSSKHVTVVHCTRESDIFAAGCAFFYFLSQGFHLFGEDMKTEILQNIMQGNRVNLLRRLKSHTITTGLLRLMTQKDAKERPSLSYIKAHLKFHQPLTSEDRLRLVTIGEIQFSTEYLVGEGFDGVSSVFIGNRLSEKQFSLIVKRMIAGKEAIDLERETRAAVLQNLNHANVLQLISFSKSDSFLILALERCLVSLDGYCRQPLLYQEVVPKLNQDQVLSEMVQGLDYIHSQKLIYRDIKPENVLLFEDASYSTKFVIKWADFGISRAVESGKEYFTKKRQGTERWFAPELIEAMEKREKEDESATETNHYTLCCQGSVECDIFALGCVYFFFLVPGVHPFGEKDSDIVENIKKGSPINIHCNINAETCYLNAVVRMTSKDPKSRPKLKDIKSKVSSDPVYVEEGWD